MRRRKENPAAGDGGAPKCLAGRLDAWLNNRIRWAIQYCAEIDELIWKLGRALQAGRLSGWERDFAMGVLDQAKCRRWSPSKKQLSTMRRLTGGLAAETDIHEADSDCAFERVTAAAADVTDILPDAGESDYTPADLDAWLDKKIADLIRSTPDTPTLESGDRAYIPVMPPWWRDDT